MKREGFAEPIGLIVDGLKRVIESRDGTSEFPVLVDSVEEVAMGLQRGKVSVVTARTSHGKTGFLLQHAWAYANRGKNVLFISLEDDRLTLVERVCCISHGWDNLELRRGKMPPDYDEKIKNFEGASLYFEDGFGFNLKEIDTAHKEIIFQNGKPADIVFYDYLGMIDNAGLKEYEQFMRTIKKWVLKRGVGFVLGVQQNRAAVGRDGEIGLANLKGAGAIEEVSDLVLVLSYPHQLGVTPERFKKEFDKSGNFNAARVAKVMDYKEFENLLSIHFTEISIAKHKGGRTKRNIPVFYQPEHYRFLEWEGVIKVFDWMKEKNHGRHISISRAIDA